MDQPLPFMWKSKAGQVLTGFALVSHRLSHFSWALLPLYLGRRLYRSSKNLGAFARSATSKAAQALEEPEGLHSV